MKKDIALVLSSGGARGIAHIGVIRELEKRGYQIKSVAGSSMGALIGGFYAAGELEKYAEWLVGLDRLDVLRLVDFSISSKGLVKGRRIIEKMKEIIPDRNIDELEIPFKAVATDIHTGEEKVFDQGTLYDAIRASISIPTVFQPKKIKETFYVDGGVLNPLPVDKVDRFPGDILVASDVNGLPDPKAKAKAKKIQKQEAQKKEDAESNSYLKQLKILQKKISNFVPEKETDDLGIFNLTNKSIGLMLHKISQLTIEQYDIDIVFRLPRDTYGTYEFHNAAEIIERGQEMAKRTLDEYESISR
jgi:NTE family protein